MRTVVLGGIFNKVWDGDTGLPLRLGGRDARGDGGEERMCISRMYMEWSFLFSTATAFLVWLRICISSCTIFGIRRDGNENLKIMHDVNFSNR